MANADIGLIGLGVMGSNLALNIAEKGHTHRGLQPHRRAGPTLSSSSAGALARQDRARARPSTELAAAIRPPRPIIIMVKAGKPVDEQIEQLLPRCSRPATSSSMPATPISATPCAASELAELQGHRLHRHGRFRRRRGRAPRPLDHGRRHPRSSGSTRRADPRPRSRPSSTASPAAAWLGDGGAGHFVKTIHNGIEYADMQMIAEIYGIMRDGLGMSAEGDRRRSSPTGTRAGSTPT